MRKVELEHRRQRLHRTLVLDTDTNTFSETCYTIGDPQDQDSESKKFTSLADAESHFDEMMEVYVDLGGFRLVAGTEADKVLTVADLEEAFGTTVPTRYRRFIESKEYLEYNGRGVQGLPGYEDAAPVCFDQRDVLAVLDGDVHEVFGTSLEGYLPMVSLADVSTGQHLSLKLDEDDLPVYFFDLELGEPFRLAETFDVFLSSLVELNHSS